MSSSIRRIGILTGGGDAPGLNAAIRAVVKTARRVYGWDVVGIEDGFEGLLGPPRTRRLDLDDVRGLLPRGGTVLGTVNRGRFVVGVDEGGKKFRNDEAFSEAKHNFERLRLDALIVVGGEGSQTIANEFAEMGVPVVGMPKTIDNDVVGTEMTFGFDTALDIATEAIDRLHTTAESHDRVILVEVMGRHVGWIALGAGVAGGADVILIPEIPFTLEKVAAKVREREAQGRFFSIIVVAEGAHPSGGGLVYADPGAVDRAARLGGIAEQVGRGVEHLTGKESRVVVLGHLQRGGTPTAFDRLLASCYGSAAVRAVAHGKFGHMVSYTHNEIVTVPLAGCVRAIKSIPQNHYLLGVARDLSISFAGEVD